MQNYTVDEMVNLIALGMIEFRHYWLMMRKIEPLMFPESMTLDQWFTETMKYAESKSNVH